MKSKRLAAIGLASGLAFGGGAGLVATWVNGAGATSSTDPTATTTAPGDTSTTAPAGDPSSTTVAGTPGTDTADADHQPGDRLREILQPLVDDGTITADQLEAVVTKLAEAGPGLGHHGRGERIVADFDAAATALNMTTAELRTELQAGKSIADVAGEKGVAVQTVVDAIVAELTTQVNAKVSDGTITQAQADEILADAPARVTDFVNGNGPFHRGHGGHGGFGPGHGGFGPGDDGDADHATAATSTTTATGS